jgi:hypothetical protein
MGFLYRRIKQKEKENKEKNIVAAPAVSFNAIRRMRK